MQETGPRGRRSRRRRRKKAPCLRSLEHAKLNAAAAAVAAAVVAVGGSDKICSDLPEKQAYKIMLQCEQAHTHKHTHTHTRAHTYPKPIISE